MTRDSSPPRLPTILPSQTKWNSASGRRDVNMSAAPSIDATSKRWLTLLALAIVASVAILAYSFLKALSPLEVKSVETQQPATDQAQEVRTGDHEAWNHPQ